jgi:chromosome segregation protein
MYLKSLELVGFKSFAEKTTLEFLPGVTAIVGPNGCGKSNVADAIRWVLGEQSAKALRGSEMADVIFSGTDGRKPVGMAEVSMTFADVDPSQLSLPGVNLEFSEITISRRVYRDGNGEYLINKTPCRLRDIQNLFMDTGVGRSSYSLMAQGQIDQILSAHPEDRRMIFEEAAGINKYKHQRKEALRKLEYTEQNLTRLTDVIKEVKRQIISLQRQAGKARRYKELFDELKALDTRLCRHKYDLMQSEISNLESQLAGSQTNIEQLATEISSRETQIADLRRSLAEIDRAISDAVNRDHELKSEGDRHAQRIGSHTERIAEFENLTENNRREIAGSEEKIRVNEQDLSRLNAEFEGIDSELAAEQAKLQTLQNAFRQLETEIADQNKSLNETKSALITLEGQLVHSRNELGALDAKKGHDALRADRLSTEKLQLQDARRELAGRLDSFNAELAGLRNSIESLRSALSKRQSESHALDAQLAAATESHRASMTNASQKRARLDALRQLFAAPDGRATLGEILEIQPAYCAAIEAALNHNLRTVLANDLADARALLAGNPVAAPELAGGHTSRAENEISAPGDAAYSRLKVKDTRFEPLVRSLLANVVIAGNLDEALAIRSANRQLAVATVRGEFVNEHGILSAVAGSQMAEVSALADEVARLEADSGEHAALKSKLEQQKQALDADAARLRDELHAQEVALATKEGELGSLLTGQRDLESKTHTVMFELQAIAEQDAEEKQRRSEIITGLRDAESRDQQLRQQLAVAQQALDALLARKEAQTNALTEQRVAVGRAQARRESIEGQRAPIAGRIRDWRERMQACADEIASHTGKIEQLRAEIAESEQRVAELASSREQLQQRLAGLQRQRGEVATGVEQAEEELRLLRKQTSDAQQQKSKFEIEAAQKRMELQNLKDHVWQRYQLNIEEVRSDSITITVADQGPTVTEQVPLPTDWDAIEVQAAELKSKLDAMGPVNVEAINEYDELDQRYKFLSQQHEDLVKAKEQLLQVIARINTTTKQLFSQTFEKIRTNFQTMFAELFGGGKANLILLDETDPLESGIEIVAKPPGKQLQSITLLSGGEKTLTATALLFAVYMVKPSPFCFLDELDAPLDESNINRFIRILQRFVTQSQFVIITHNKRTIGMADALYGITMEEHGVSKVVSVKFSPRDEAERRKLEKSREEQEDRIDGAATLRPHEEELHNDLLAEKEQTIAPITDAPPIVAETTPKLSAAPAPIADEVKAAVEAVKAANESVQKLIEQPVES